MTIETRTWNRRQFLRHAMVYGAGLPILLMTGCGGSSASKLPSTSATGLAATPSTVGMAPMAGMSPAATFEIDTATPTTLSGTQASPTVANRATAPTSVAPRGTPESATVEIKIIEPSLDYNTWGYDPQDLKVSAGTTVTWVNTGGASHTVTTDDGTSFDSGPIAPDSNFSHTMNSVGVFPYYCSLHPWMKATVTVTE
jgi:plastocyanin